VSRLARLSAWREPSAERLAHQSFLADVHARWTPSSAADRRLERRSRVTHLHVRLFSGGASLAPATAAAPVSVLGMTLFAISPAPADPMFVPGPPTWSYLLMTLGLVLLSVEAAVSPRRVRPVAFLLRVSVPVGVAAVVMVARLNIVDARDEVLRAGLVGIAVAVVAVPATARRLPRAHRGVVRLTGVAFFVSTGPNAGWAMTYADHGYGVLAVAAIATAVGAAMIAWAFARAHIESPGGGGTRAQLA
jgi:hypothetical protein